MLGDDERSLYVVFMGTKHMRDLLSDANFLQEAVWKAADPAKRQQVTLHLMSTCVTLVTCVACMFMA